MLPLGQIGGRPSNGFWGWLGRWWRKDSAAVVKKAKEIRAGELAEAVTESIIRKWPHSSPDYSGPVQKNITNLLAEIADGRTTLEPNPSQLARAREELQCQRSTSRPPA